MQGDQMGGASGQGRPRRMTPQPGPSGQRQHGPASAGDRWLPGRMWTWAHQLQDVPPYSVWGAQSTVCVWGRQGDRLPSHPCRWNVLAFLVIPTHTVSLFPLPGTLPAAVSPPAHPSLPPGGGFPGPCTSRPGTCPWSPHQLPWLPSPPWGSPPLEGRTRAEAWPAVFCGGGPRA